MADIVLSVMTFTSTVRTQKYPMSLRTTSPSSRAPLKGATGATKAGARASTSGTGILADSSPSDPGYETSKIYSGIADIKEILAPLDGLVPGRRRRRPHRAKDTGVPMAIVCPSVIHGVGKGLVKKRSFQIPWLTEAILKRGRGFSVGPGENWWDHIHIDDLAEAYITLTDEALKKDRRQRGVGRRRVLFR